MIHNKYFKIFYVLSGKSPSVLLYIWVGHRKGIRPVKSWVLVCCWWRFDWSFAGRIAPRIMAVVVTTAVVTTTAIILAAIKTRIEAFWYRLTTVVLGKWPLNECFVAVTEWNKATHSAGFCVLHWRLVDETFSPHFIMPRPISNHRESPRHGILQSVVGLSVCVSRVWP